MNDNNLNNNSNKVNTYRATSNLNTAIENPQINVNSATGINIKNSNNNYYADAKQTDSKFLNNDIPNSTKTNIDNYLNNDNNEFVINKNSKGIKTGDIGFIDNKGFVHFVERKKRVYKITAI